VIAAAAGVLARPRDWLYLEGISASGVQMPPRRSRSFRWSPMASPIFTSRELPGIPARRLAPAIVIGAAGFGAVLLVGALALWFHYGTAVFFEMIASGISACF
jgi:hypothetical protein